MSTCLLGKKYHEIMHDFVQHINLFTFPDILYITKLLITPYFVAKSLNPVLSAFPLTSHRYTLWYFFSKYATL